MVDLIITKSVSRFARNTVDSLTTIRKLKEHGTEVFFEESIARNARVAQNQEAYQQEFEKLTRRYEDTRAQLAAVQAKAHGKKSRARRIGMFIAAIENLPGEVTEFNDVTWTYMVDHVTVYAKDDIRFTLNSGAEIRA